MVIYLHILLKEILGNILLGSCRLHRMAMMHAAVMMIHGMGILRGWLMEQ
jgi:hypothetical protein